MKDTILKYIKKTFGTKSNGHFSYCLFPEEKCSCRKIKKLDYNTSLVNGGYIDSFSLMVVIVFLEKNFNIKIPEKERITDNFDTINRMADLVIRLKQ